MPNVVYAAFHDRHALRHETVGFGVKGSEVYGRLGHEEPPGKWTKLMGTVDALTWLETVYVPHHAQCGWASRGAGEYHPRFFNGSYYSGFDAAIRPWSDDEQKEVMQAEEQVQMLDNDLVDIARVAAPSPKTKATFGSKIRNTLMLACTEVEAQLKGILLANGYQPPKKYMNTTDYVRVAGPMRLAEYSMKIQRYRDYPEIFPFKSWSPVAATDTLPWYAAYNAVKHDRAKGFELASLENALAAVAGLHVLLIAQYGMTSMRQLTRDSFFLPASTPVWAHRDRTYPPLPSEPWLSVPFSF